MQERVVLVDEQDRELGEADKLEAHRTGALHRAFSVFVFDRTGRVLLQRRAQGKYHSGGRWSNTCCGHPRPGERIEAAARRRLNEEMSVDCELQPVGRFVYRAAVGELIEHELDYVLVGRFDGEPRPDPLEVAEWRRADLPALARDADAHPERYTVWLPRALDLVRHHAPQDPPSFVLSRWLFLRLLGLVYAVAFTSLGSQIVGLAGTHGILPAGEFLSRAHTVYGATAYRLWPTLGWISASDVALRLYAMAGIALSALLMAGIAPRLALALLWGLYLSLTVAGQTFLSFQWDALLLETGLLALFYAPPVWRERAGGEGDPPPTPLGRWLIWLLLFRFMVLSGGTKLMSGDPTWRNLTALSYHYWSQPLPTWTSWYAAQFPDWVQRVSVLGMFAVEIGVPFVIFPGARRPAVRYAACALLIGFQLAIAGTGNYGFFNLLTIVLCLSLLDDDGLRRLVPARWRTRLPAGVPDATWSVERPVRVGLAGVLVLLSALAFARKVRETVPSARRTATGWGDALLDVFEPLRSINGYGLFRVMTTQRPEIVIEGSGDGALWHEYDFRWKPGALARRPRFVQPHQPRLDWQMWFAALDPRSAESWLVPLLRRLLEGEPSVWDLIGPRHPAGEPPRYLRLVYYRYRFSTPQIKRETGAWWQRELVGYLTPAVSLTDLTPAR
jgi:isopentenyl-diphosphate delta-isomerase type 1